MTKDQGRSYTELWGPCSHAQHPSRAQIPSPAALGSPLRSSPRAKLPINPKLPLARFKIPLVSHKTGNPAHCRKAETKKQPVSPQTWGYTSQLHSTKHPGRSSLRLGRCITRVPGKLQSSHTPCLDQLWGCSALTKQKKHPDRGSLEPTNQSTCLHACAWTPSQNTARPLGPTLSCRFQNNSNSCEVSL